MSMETAIFIGMTLVLLFATWTLPIKATVLAFELEIDCGSTYGLFAGFALALMKMRWVWISFVSRPLLAIELNRLCTPGSEPTHHPLPLQ